MTRPRGAALLAVAIAGTIAVRFAEPIYDGDLFWHMAYARQMLERGTLRLDHAAFSWMPEASDLIYCAWLSQLAFFALWEGAGAWSVFALRYAVVAAVALLAWAQMRRFGLAFGPFAALIVLVLVLGSYAGSLPKPELWSLFAWNALVFLLFRVKREHDERRAARLLWCIPALMVVWVNAHGSFICAAPLLAAAAVGETLNRRLSPALALAPRVHRALLAATAATAVATVLTPYGLAYPRQLFVDFVLGARARPDVAWNVAYRSLGSRIGAPLHPEELVVVMGVVLLGLATVQARRAPRGARVDWMIVLANASTIPFSFAWARTAFLWPAVFAASAAVLSADVRTLANARPRWLAARPLREAALGVCLYLAALTCWDAWSRPFAQSWLGFGIGYVNPVLEAEYLARHELGPRLYNVGDAGGYLLWRLGPRVKVMADGRSFPYLSWFDEHFAFVHGRKFEEFLARHPADAAVIDLDKPLVLDRFLAAPEWRLVFYGPTSAIFLPRTREPPPVDAGGATRFADLRNAVTARRVLAFAERVGDDATAATLRARLAGPLRHQHGALQPSGQRD